MSGTAFKDTQTSRVNFDAAHKLSSRGVQLSEAISLSEHLPEPEYCQQLLYCTAGPKML